MTECQCTDVKRMLTCQLGNAAGDCLSAPQEPNEPGTQPQHTEPHALNSDALTNSLTSILGGATVTNEL